MAQTPYMSLQKPLLLFNNKSIFNTKLFPISLLVLKPPLQHPPAITFSTSDIFHLPISPSLVFIKPSP